MNRQAGSKAEKLAAILIVNVKHYFPELRTASIEVKLVSGGERVLSSLYRFRIVAGNQTRDILIKLPGPVESAPPENRPKLIRVPDARQRFKREFLTLREIDRFFGGLEDPRFSSVRILDFLDEHCAIVMEFKRVMPLNKLLIGANRLQGQFNSAALLAALRGAGTWLKYFHSNIALSDMPLSNYRREDFNDNNAQFISYLSSHKRRSSYFEALMRQIIELSDVHLPNEFPTAIGHGDYAPRNVLVGPDGQLSAIDTRGLVRAPVFEDLSVFLVAVRTNRIQAYSLGTVFGERMLARAESAFLGGYFGREEIPHSSIALFAIQSLLDKWCARTESALRQREKRTRLSVRFTNRAMERCIKDEIERRLGMLRAMDRDHARN